MSKGFASNYRIVLIAGLVLLSFAGLGSRLVWLHVIDRDQLLSYVQKARRQIITSYARRGDITDVRGAVLATSHSLIVLGVDPQSERPEDRAKWSKLAQLLGMNLADVEPIMTTRYRSGATRTAGSTGPGLAPIYRISVGPSPAAAPAADPASDDDSETVLDDPDPQGKSPIRWAKLSDEVTEPAYADILKLGISGVYGNRVYRRTYPGNTVAAHLIGYVNRKEAPVTGIEFFADFYLRGHNGWVESEKDGHQRELAQFRTREVPAADGYTVVLSLDATVQHIAEAELQAIAERYQPEKSTIIVSDPRTGFILAMANYPTFNLNEYNDLRGADER